MPRERTVRSAASLPSIFCTRSMRSSSLGEVLADQRAVAQHRHAVADLVDLLEEVRDEQDGDTAVLEIPDHPEQLGHLIGVEARGRLVEDEHPHIARDRPRDRDQLLDGERVAAEHRGRDRSRARGRAAPPRRRAASAASRLRRTGAAPGRASMFSATERFGSRSISWYTVRMPWRWASAGDARCSTSPSSGMVPSSSGWRRSAP